MQRICALVLALVLALVMTACSSEDPGSLSGRRAMGTYGGAMDDESGDVGEPTDAPLTPVDDTPDPTPSCAPSAPSAPSAPPTTSPPATLKKMETTGDLNLRSGPSTSYAVLLVMPSGSVVDVVDPIPQTGFMRVRFSGTAGWASTKYLETPSATTTPAPSPSTGVDGPPSPDNAIARAAAAVGFSYFWGGGSWSDSGATSSNKGSCSGSCPSCTHSGKFGADCSGMVGKAWQFGTKDLEVSSHPYSTSSFINDVAGKWSTVSRGALKRGDAMVYNSGGGGHIVLWEKGDGWGTSTVYECKGCSYGCVHNARTFTSSYKGIRRAGF